MKLMRKTLILSALLYCFGLAASTGRSSELQMLAKPGDAIRDLQPALSPGEVRRLENALIRAAQAPGCEIAWPVLLSVAYNESSLDRAALNPKTGDYGLMQINKATVARLRLDRARLMRDAEYSFRTGCRVLTANKRQFSDQFPYWIGFYRAGTRVWLHRVRKSAVAYDTIIRATAERITGVGVAYAANAF